MSALYLEFGGDFVLSSAGTLLQAEGWDEIRQRIERLILTNAAGFQSDGTPITAQYVFHPDYGLSAPARIGDVFNQDYINNMSQILYQGILQDPGVDPTNPPVITAALIGLNEIQFTIGVSLKNGQQQTLVLTLP